MNKQKMIKKAINWEKPTVQTVTLQQLNSMVTASACSLFAGLCRENMR